MYLKAYLSLYILRKVPQKHVKNTQNVIFIEWVFNIQHRKYLLSINESFLSTSGQLVSIITG